MWAVTASSNPASSLQAQRPRDRMHSVHSLTCRVVGLIPCPLSGVKDSRSAFHLSALLRDRPAPVPFPHFRPDSRFPDGRRET